ncbi:Polyphosphate kinase 2, PPK2 family [Geodermatophilus dictyosporus]|uniref:Polyphosphate kinase 2, PPK2 family n=1 Tax=Geodermatophilus dictyosporus TaxID=1523247 RepID=A0A1I5NKT1_9ACTN|nr:hypothetical protein [Geodermatophilus dictyosporus]SFP21936.1 Polyphosphate kinase 2, PPK2 family [Geodermatophilus dictyosporus]
MATGERPVALLREALAVEVLLDATWHPAELLGWRHDGPGTARLRVRLDWDGDPRVLWTPLTLARLPVPGAVPAPRRSPPALPAPHRAAHPPVRRAAPSPPAPPAGTSSPSSAAELRLQVELLKLQAGVREERRRVVVVLEGSRDAGQQGIAAALVEHLDPRWARVVTDAPDRAALLPRPGGLLVADRCWCGPAPVAVDELVARERALLADGVQLVKLWCSVRRPDADPVAEAALVGATSTPGAPWTVLAADDEPRARLAALRQVLSTVDYRGRSDDVLGRPDPLLVAAVPPLAARP